MTTEPCLAKTFFEDILTRGVFATSSIPVRELTDLLQPYSPCCMRKGNSFAIIFDDKSFLHVLTCVRNDIVLAWHIDPFKTLAEFFQQADNSKQLNSLFVNAETRPN